MAAALASIVFGNYKVIYALSSIQILCASILEALPFVLVLAVSIKASKVISHGHGKTSIPEVTPKEQG